jgi:hypothetical protein
MSGKIVGQILISQFDDDEVKIQFEGTLDTKVKLYGLLRMGEKLIDMMDVAKTGIIAPPMNGLPNLRGPKQP